MKQSLYLLSGLLCDETVWRAQIDALQDLAVVDALDFRGYESITAMAERVLAQAPAKFALAGHSMGARVALEVYRLAPERVERIALLDTGTHPAREGEASTRQVLINLAREQGMSAVAERWLAPMLHPAHVDDESMMLPLVQMVERMGVDTLVGQIKALLQRPDATEQLRAIQCPALIGVGREDVWSTLAQHQEMAEKVAHARLVVFEHSGHMAPFEAPEAVNAALRAWLQE
ncbi:MAG: alpha/beta hydrolase [Pseudomonas sp.]|uniref:alpha/beta fold hydrolase n=1 Tax=Pseudomonas sp. TaxID=306 RepID=UPI003982596D